MALDKDRVGEWHLRMQSYFPKESREFRFQDKETGEIHIADVFDLKTNTVIEFQHSHISEKEYLDRTYFHLNNGRRIVWVFDESKNESNPNNLGKLKPDDLCTPNWIFKNVSLHFLYENKSFKWLYAPRKFLSSGPNLIDFLNKYSVFVYVGENENTLHRIIYENYGFEYITLSIEDTIITDNISTDLFFISERTILSQSPWKDKIEIRRKYILEKAEYNRNVQRINKRKSLGLDLDLNRCPLCRSKLKLKLIELSGRKPKNYYLCTNYPKCKFHEEY